MGCSTHLREPPTKLSQRTKLTTQLGAAKIAKNSISESICFQRPPGSRAGGQTGHKYHNKEPGVRRRGGIQKSKQECRSYKSKSSPGVASDAQKHLTSRTWMSFKEFKQVSSLFTLLRCFLLLFGRKQKHKQTNVPKRTKYLHHLCFFPESV